MIAMEFDLDYLDLARWNGIPSPYTIHRGQNLRLHPSQTSSTTNRAATGGKYYIVQSGDTLSVVAEKLGLRMGDLARWNRLKSPYRIHVGQKLRLSPQTLSLQASSGAESKTQPKLKPKLKLKQSRVNSSGKVAKRSSARGSTGFTNPSSGKIVQRYSKQRGITGVEFSGKRGDPILAAGDGKVVYSGTGLVRYGKLLIIKHDNNLLTAYAHNSQLQVGEGDLVKIGQQIAKMGSSGTDRVKLHFEVRKRGKPVDPMNYLSAISGR